MGINEHGVAIGNEAIFSKVKRKENRLLGMDLLRLGLERGKNAKESASYMIEYLEKYGVSGSNSNRKPLYYDNAFLITDRRESYVLETEWKDYTLNKVGNDWSISNFPSFRTYSLDRLYSTLGKGIKRQSRTLSMIKRSDSLQDMMGLMRMHHNGFTHPRNGNNEDVCMHGGFLSRKDQTANSFVIEIWDAFSLIWTTHSGNPCVSVYKPIIFMNGMIVGNPLPDRGYWKTAQEMHYKLFMAPDEEYERSRENVLKIQNDLIARFEPIRNKLLSSISLEKEEIDSFYEYAYRIERDQRGGKKVSSMYGLWLFLQLRRLANAQFFET